MKAKENPDHTVTWLHLSDAHLCKPENGWEYSLILEKLQEDFKKLQAQHHLHPDLVFFTGDLVFGHLSNEAGKSISHQFKEAAAFLNSVRESFSPPVPLENVFIVPGNHDVDRSSMNPDTYAGFENNMKGSYQEMEKNLNRLLQDKGPRWNDFARGLKEYKEFLEENRYTHLLKDPDRLIYGEVREIRGVKIGIAGLNSVWSSHQDNEKGKLWLAGHWQVQTLFNKIRPAAPSIKIALMHHPVNWFNPAEDPSIKREIGTHFDFFLHGHEHEDWVENIDGGCTSISAGACYGGSQEETGYNLVKLDIESGLCETWFRQYDRKGGGWIPGQVYNKTNYRGTWIIEKGSLEPPAPTAEEIPEGPSHDSHIDVPGTKPGRETRSAAELGISPDSPESRGVFGRQKDIARVAGALDKVPMAAVYGMAGIGKSRVIDEVKRTPGQKDKVFANCFITRQIKLDGVFQQLARVLGCRDENPAAKFTKLIGKMDFSLLKEYYQSSQPAFIHVVDAHLLFDNYKFRDEEIKEFLLAITRYYPGTSIILESRISLQGLLPLEVCESLRLNGIDGESMVLYFQHPFPKEPEVSWTMSREEKAVVFKWLGGMRKKEGAHPLAMVLLANVANGTGLHPARVLEGYEQQQLLAKELDTHLFNDLYERVLSPAEQHLLRLCALYREGIWGFHAVPLDQAVRETGVFWRLVGRCLLNPDAREEWFYLHAVIGHLTGRRIDKQADEYYNNHEVIAEAWLKQLGPGVPPIMSNIKAAGEAFYHLAESRNYRRFNELSHDLLRRNRDIIPQLDRLATQLFKDRSDEDYRCVLELLVKLAPEQRRYHRFLAQTLEKLKGGGNEEALAQYKEAFRLDPTFPQHLADLGKCLLRRKSPGEFIALVKQMDKKVYGKVMDETNLAIYANCLDREGQGEKASRLRQEQIRKSRRNPAFYNDEANDLAGKGKFAEALEILGKAQALGCADDFTLAIKAGILARQGEEGAAAATRLRQEQIHRGSRNPVFYADEANDLAGKGQFAEALEILGKAEARGCADDFTLAIKAGILARQGDEGAAAATRLRQEQIHRGSRDPVFYADEAIYLAGKGQYAEALEILGKAEALGCTDNVTKSIKAKILRAMDREKHEEL